MSKTKLDDLFINKMLEETYQFLPEDEAARSPVDLLKYFQSHDAIERYDSRDSILFNYLNRHGIVFSPLDLCSESQCFRMNLKKAIYDIPSNWGLFTHLKDHASNLLICLDENYDHDCLRTVFSRLIETQADIVIIGNQGRLYLALVKSGAKEEISWLMKYLGVQDLTYFESARPMAVAA